VLVLTHNVQPDTFRSQVSRLGTESFIPYGTHKLTEGTGLQSLLLWRHTMAQVTYRGVQYDTNERKQVKSQKVQETYRGVKFEKELTAA